MLVPTAGLIAKERRDPRFNSLSAGQVDQHLHSQAYNFLPSLLRDEMHSLRRQVGLAAKAERSCQLVEKPHFTAERERLEIELGRLRTKVERREREERERVVLAGAKKEEREKREAGKGAYYMKECEFALDQPGLARTLC
jgi:ribosomal RNA-processing protein 36